MHNDQKVLAEAKKAKKVPLVLTQALAPACAAFLDDTIPAPLTTSPQVLEQIAFSNSHFVWRE